jgi:hypothetical protein
MTADGNHARIDGFVSLGVVASAIVVSLGAQIADPIIGLTITLVILKITWDSWNTVRKATIDLEHVGDENDHEYSNGHMNARARRNFQPMRVEVLVFEGCPHAELAVHLARDVASEVGVNAEIEIVRIDDLDAAQAHRFLGSPSIRIDGADVELGADRRQPTYGCRIYQGGGGLSGLPDREWVVAALRKAAQSA